MVRTRSTNSKPRMSRMDAAIDAMESMGFVETLVRKRVNQLLTVYGGHDSWKFIEENGYKVLIDSFLDEQEETTIKNCNVVERHNFSMEEGERVPDSVEGENAVASMTHQVCVVPLQKSYELIRSEREDDELIYSGRMAYRIKVPKETREEEEEGNNNHIEEGSQMTLCKNNNIEGEEQMALCKNNNIEGGEQMSFRKNNNIERGAQMGLCKNNNIKRGEQMPFSKNNNIEGGAQMPPPKITKIEEKSNNENTKREGRRLLGVNTTSGNNINKLEINLHEKNNKRERPFTITDENDTNKQRRGQMPLHGINVREGMLLHKNKNKGEKPGHGTTIICGNTNKKQGLDSNPFLVKHSNNTNIGQRESLQLQKNRRIQGDGGNSLLGNNSNNSHQSGGQGQDFNQFILKNSNNINVGQSGSLQLQKNRRIQGDGRNLLLGNNSSNISQRGGQGSMSFVLHSNNNNNNQEVGRNLKFEERRGNQTNQGVGRNLQFEESSVNKTIKGVRSLPFEIRSGNKTNKGIGRKPIKWFVSGSERARRRG